MLCNSVFYQKHLNFFPERQQITYGINSRIAQVTPQKNKPPHKAVFFLCFSILSSVRKSDSKNHHYFTNLRTFKKKRLEI